MAQLPPQYPNFPESPAPKRNNNRVLWITLIIVCGGGCLVMFPILAAILFPVFSQAQHAAKVTTALSNAKQLSTAALMYATDWDDKLFPTEPYGTALATYLKNPAITRSPLSQRNFSFNEKMLGATLAQIENPQEVVMFYDGENGQLTFTNKSSVVSYADTGARRIRPGTTVVWEPKFAKPAPEPAKPKKP
jgi:type II secretory pathway pseudopilin PulG